MRNYSVNNLNKGLKLLQNNKVLNIFFCAGYVMNQPKMHNNMEVTREMDVTLVNSRH